MTQLADRHPAMAGFSEVIPLSGFSGAQVAALRTPAGSLFVRKAGCNASTSSMLKRQAERQRWLKTAVAGAAEVPDVLAEGYVEEHYFYDMPFIASRDAVSFLAQASFDDLKSFSERVETLLATLSGAKPEPGALRPPTKQAVLGKLDEILARTCGRFTRVIEPLYEAACAIESFAGANAGGATAAHGDLTLENILIGARGQLWLIDTIDSPFDHYWVDWSKLFQDCEGRWHMHRGRPVAVSVTWWLRNRWMAAAARLASDYPARHYLLLALTFARILPYARSESDVAYVTDRVEAFGKAALMESMKG
jgi:aminoglycoside phosphotransferase (APT) family kinase protein